MSGTDQMPPSVEHPVADVPPDVDLFTDPAWIPPAESEYPPYEEDLAHLDQAYYAEPDDLPPYFGDDVSSYVQVPDRTADRRTKQTDPALTEKVLQTARGCLASAHHRVGEEVIDLVQYILGSKNAMAALTQTQLRTLKRVGEVFVSVAADRIDDQFDIFDLPDLDAASRGVVAEIAVLRTRVTTGDTVQNPTSVWRALCDFIQKEEAKAGARMLIECIDGDLPADELMKVYSELEPPTTQKTVVNATFSKTAGEWEQSDAQAAAERASYRISSGYRTWDYVFTLKDAYGNPAEPLGCWSPGEFHGLASPTGNGKSAISRRLVTAAAEDLVVGWGHEHAKVVIAITEEAPSIVYRAAGLAEGQPFHHLRNNIVIADIGASRRRFIHAVWDCVIDAYHMSKATGQPIVDCGMPEAIILDYIGGIVEAGEGADTTAIENTANLIMRGLCGWRIQEMEQFSGESFSAYAGMSWPSGMENFRPAVITFIQTKKLVKPEFYDPNSKSCSVADYTVEKADGSPGWEVLPGDFIVPTRSDVRGSGILQNHLTSLVMAHRSRPQKNSKVLDPVTGKMRLEDDRARLIFLKTRNGSDIPFVPMRFDSNPEGLRGQYYDLLTEQAIKLGHVTPLASYTQEGDPILPARPVRSPFEGVTY